MTGAYVWDAAGRRYVDATAGLWFTNVGHGRTEIADAVAAQIGRIAAYSTFGDYAVDTTVALAERLARDRPGARQQDLLHLRRVRLGRHRGQAGPPVLAGDSATPTKKIVIGREKAYHGMHVAGTALAGIPGNHDGYGELMADVRHRRLGLRQGAAGAHRASSAPTRSPPSSANR